MNAVRLAFALIRVPRLFVSLLFWPMIVGICIAISQLGITSVYLGLVTETAVEYEKRVNTVSPESHWLQEQLFGNNPPPAEVVVCRWSDAKTVTPSGCTPGKLDIKVLAANPTAIAVDDLQRHFSGVVHHLHVCNDCTFPTAINIHIAPDGSRETIINSLGGLGMLALIDANNKAQINSHFISAKLLIEQFESISGTVFFNPAGLEKPINISEASKTMLLILNTSLLVVIALWLSLRGHRRVLDYFARNDSLLPLVASCGKTTFYSALWIITLLRVGFFLLMVTPATVLAFSQITPSSTMQVFMNDSSDFILWIFALLSSLSSLTIIASIAELKHRTSWISFLYRYVPMIVCFVGTAAWFFCLFLATDVSASIRAAIAICPILGISPVLLSPLVSISPTLLAAHATLASILVILVMRNNSRWFAAHLEEL